LEGKLSKNGIRRVRVNGRIVKIDKKYGSIRDNFRWRLNENGYPISTIALHQLIFFMENGYVPDSRNTFIDHVNRDRRDCTAINLRPATKSQNMINRNYENRSGFRGVIETMRVKADGSKSILFHVSVNFNGIRYNLGSYGCKYLAAMAYNEGAKHYHRDFAVTNKIPKKYLNLVGPLSGDFDKKIDTIKLIDDRVYKKRSQYLSKTKKVAPISKTKKVSLKRKPRLWSARIEFGGVYLKLGNKYKTKKHAEMAYVAAANYLKGRYGKHYDVNNIHVYKYINEKVKRMMEVKFGNKEIEDLINKLDKGRDNGVTNEDIIVKLSDLGVYKIKRSGEIWKHAVRRGCNKACLKKIKPKRAEIIKTWNDSEHMAIQTKLNRKHVVAQVPRIIWTKFKGRIPKGCKVYHINKDGSDNRLENLALMKGGEGYCWSVRNSYNEE
jgi:hypothetical protein